MIFQSVEFGRLLMVSGLPVNYWLWNAKRNEFWCRVFAWLFVPCENLLDNASDDCESSISREDPGAIYPGGRKRSGY